MAAVDVEDVEVQLRAVGGDPGQHLAGIAGEIVDAAGKFARQKGHARRGVAMKVDVDPVVDQVGIGAQRQQRAVAGVDPDLDHARLEPGRAPEIAARRRQTRRRRAPLVVGLLVPVEDAAFQRLAGFSDEAVQRVQAAEESGRENLRGIASVDEIIRDFRRL
jgi:hypothetical protein